MKLIAALAGAALAFTASAASAQNFKLATMVNPPHPWIDAAEALKAEVEEKTDGRVTIEIFMGGSLGNDQTVLDEMRLGTIDLIIGGTQNASPFFKKFEIFSLNYLFGGMDSFEKATASDGEVLAYFQDVYDEAGLGLKLLALTGGGIRNFSDNVREVHEPGDIKGMKMRVPGSQMDARMWQTFGALTTSLPWTELYTGVQTGVVDAFESSIAAYYGSKLYEVAPYHAQTQHQFMMSHITMAEPSFNRLSEEDQAIFLEAVANAAALGTAKGEEYDATLLDTLQKEHGVTVTDVDKTAFMEMVVPLHEEIASELDALDLLKILQSYND
ncbi:TRAP transporter substrate-binding protein [Acuticoccus sp. M5D2P5]|uniref:TRAP transporter substrate-binding protein n=1 Tax=Acuticoccus kalidii TaxID=2910977 RepID=UPI001F378C83|nr:TRAP transporter substrate-binding protein [Acuticoccus kalidii]MCF3936251.1 TRAP transporter substrate-binding protein [Acuticoccus kalidii]